MAKPSIFWQAMDNGSLPSTQDDFHWNKEPDAANTTHVGTKFVGDDVAASVGLDLGAMTNLQVGDEFPLVISHSATEPITNCQFYYTVSTNVRGDATGFANEDDLDPSGQSGLEKDWYELRAWGDGAISADESPIVDNSTYLYGMRIRYDAELDPTPFSTGVMDELANSKILTNDAKWSGSVGAVGTSGLGEESWIEPWVNYISNDCAVIRTSLSIPDIEAAGVRSIALTLRLTYTF